MLTSKQRAYLGGLANGIDTIIMVGKGGMSDDIVKQTKDALKAREIVKGKVLAETSPVTVREAAETLADATKAELVKVIGNKFILYKRNDEKPIIVLPKAKGSAK